MPKSWIERMKKAEESKPSPFRFGSLSVVAVDGENIDIRLETANGEDEKETIELVDAQALVDWFRSAYGIIGKASAK